MTRTFCLHRATTIVAVTTVVLLNAAPVLGVLVPGGGNTTAPTDDPGFANVAASPTGGATVTYLGNGWCITAAHVTVGTYNGPWSNVTLNGTQYQVTQVVNSPFGAADLKMFQINGDPGLAPLSIAITDPGSSTQVTMIGNGFGASTQQYWNVTVPVGWNGNTAPGTWTGTAGGGAVAQIPATTFWNGGSVAAGTYQASGFAFDGSHVVRWGQNLISKTGLTDGATNYFYTTFNDPKYSSGQLTASSEAQAVNGDSGGGVFYKSGSTWQLLGIMYGQYALPGQPSSTAVFGNLSGIADLSTYRSAIQSIDTPLSWTGQAGSTWDTTSTSWASWNSTSGAVTASNAGGTYYAATFGDKNPLTNASVANTAITIQATGVTPPSVVLNNSTAVSYSFNDATGSTAGIGNSASGPTMIIKNGTGSVTFLGSNSFSGPVYVNAGLLNLQNSSALGTSYRVTVASGAALELQNNVSLPATIPLTLTGTGLAGGPAGTTGALNSVSGNNTWAGPITLGASGATINSAAAGSTLTLSGTVALGASSLTFSGAGNTSVTSVISGTGSVIKSGAGYLSLAAGNTYTGGTMINGGVVFTGSLGDPTSAVTVSAMPNSTAALVLGGQGANPSQWASSLSGSVASGGAAVVSIGANDTFNVNQATNTTFGGTLYNSGNFIKSGGGTLEIDGAPTLNNNSTIQVSGGTLKFNLTSGTPSVGSGVTAMVVSGGGTLQLAGAVSALATPSYQVDVNNNSTAGAGGLYVTGTNQQVGSITGTGNTVVAAGASLTATSIAQGALVIGGSVGSPGLVTIQASGIGSTTSPATSVSSTNSVSDAFISYLAAGDFSLPFATSASLPSAAAFDLSGGPGSISMSGSSFGSMVPEPSAASLATVAVVSASIAWVTARMYRRRRRSGIPA